MRSEEDLVVRLAAANALKVAVDDFEFSVDQFLPYLETVFVLLLQILKVRGESLGVDGRGGWNLS